MLLKPCFSALLVVLSAPFLFGDANWPQWRGPDRTDVSRETGLLKEWPKDGPKLSWLLKDAGIGYSGVAVVGERLFTMGSRQEVERLLAIDTKDGKEVWVADIAEELGNDWGNGPRGTPSVDGDKVYALGGQGTLICAQVADGKVLWKKSMQELGGKIAHWGYTESVLVDGDRVVCTPGGKKGAIAALNKQTGELMWQSKDFTDEAQYSSIVPAQINGTRQYVQLTMKSIVGINAADGKLLWQSSWPGQTAVIPTPIVRDNHVYVSSGYGVGCRLLKIGDGNKVVEVYSNKNMRNHHGGVILVGDQVFGHNDASRSEGGWVCQDFLKGDVVWKERKLGKGAIACADGMLYLYEEESGTCVLIDASAKGWNERGRFKIDPKTKLRKPRGMIWTHPVIAGGKLYLRDQELLFCYDVKAN